YALAVGPGRAPEELEAHRVALPGLLKNGLTAPVGTGPYAPGLSRMDVTRTASQLRRKLEGYVRAVDAELAAALREELRAVETSYRRLLRRSGALDFADLLHLTRDLVRDQPESRRALQERFQHIMVDELQDTDPLQMELVLLLSTIDSRAKDPFTAQLAPGRLTLVGDPKQSIYGFRRADPALFARARATLVRSGGELLSLGTSHRSVTPIQALVNRAFGDLVKTDGGLPLSGGPSSQPNQPALIALPARHPVDRSGELNREAIRRSHPSTVAAFLAWLVRESNWQVRDLEGRRPVRASDVCLLFRSVRHQRELATAAFEAELERQGLPSVLVGARALHNRDEIEGLLTVLHALEWPEDELMVYGALKGPFFGFTDASLWEWRRRQGSLHPFRAPKAGAPEDPEIRAALEVLRTLSLHRNRRSFADTLQAVLRSTRAHVGLGLRPGGGRVLDNVQSALDLAREFEESEGFSFRGFVHHLRAAADRPGSTEGTVNEEAADGIRMMTVHRAKGLEFPVVVLADPHQHGRGWASEVRRPEAGLMARKTAGLIPRPFLEGEAEGKRLATAEVRRLAYVAATRARDLLIVPTAGPHLPSFEQDSWLRPILKALRPRPRAEPQAAPETASFGPESYVRTPEGRRFRSVCPGRYVLEDGIEVTWWDPNQLPDRPPATFGLAHERFLADGPAAAPSVERFTAWREALETRREMGRAAAVERVDLREPPSEGLGELSIVERTLAGASSRPSGQRYGQLIHRVLEDLPWDASSEGTRALVRGYGRSLEASAAEVDAASEAMEELLQDGLFERARTAARALRRHPVWMDTPEGVVDGVLDLLFEETDGWVAVDFVTAYGADEGRDNWLRARMGRLLSALNSAGWPMSIGIVLRV
ncbi:MAG: UvrD-helicase domain-containing protein, partial [Myxococcota bacterium]